jgi:hypothetical protein
MKEEMRQGKPYCHFTKSIASPFFIVTRRRVKIQDLYDLVIQEAKRFINKDLSNERLGQILCLHVETGSHVIELGEDMDSTITLLPGSQLVIEWDYKAHKQCFNEEIGLVR